MSESPKTDIGGDVTNSLSGSFSGPVTTDDRSQTQSVSVVVQQAAQEGLPPELRNVALHAMVLGVIKALQDLSDRIYYDKKADDKIRQERQGLADERYEEAKEHREMVNAQLDTHTIKLFDMGDDIVELTKQTAANTRRVSRLEIILAVMVGLVGAAGLLLIGVALWVLVTK